MPRELGVDVDNMHVAFGRVPDDGLVVLASGGVGLDVDAQRAVEFQLQAVVFVSICALLLHEGAGMRLT